MQACLKRLKKEAANASAEKDEFVTLTVNPESIKEWKADILGPPGSAYENYLFTIFIRVGDNYPMLPPSIVFETKIFHPNVHFDTGIVVNTDMKTELLFLRIIYLLFVVNLFIGEICLDILKKEWTPAWTLMSACRAIVALLADPAPDR